jgi:hypothetical protein
MAWKFILLELKRMSAGPPRGVWGQRAAVASPAVSLDWLVGRMNKVGLDGSICVEYISSLLELHKSSSGPDRDAAICDFLHDSVHSSALKGIAEQNRFVDETISEIRSRLSVNTSSSPPAEQASLAGKPKSAPFKKGIKITGAALKQVVGNVKPSFVQQYSDDERPAPPPPPPPAATVSRFVSSMSSAEPLETPSRQTSVGNRRRNKAKEIAPDEDWEDEDDNKTVWKTPFESARHRLAMSSPESQNVSVVDILPTKLEISTEPETLNIEDQSTQHSSPTKEMAEAPTQDSTTDSGVPKSVLLSPQSLLFSLPTDILSFDFKFEEEEEQETTLAEEAPAAAPFDLLKSMFETPTELVASPTVSQPPVVTTERFMPEQELSQKVYSVPFLLSVLNQLKLANGGSVPVPDELKGLSRADISPPRPRSDSFGWRSAPTAVEESSGSWRASGYSHKPTKRSAQAPVTTSPEGFW